MFQAALERLRVGFTLLMEVLATFPDLGVPDGSACTLLSKLDPKLHPEPCCPSSGVAPPKKYRSRAGVTPQGLPA